MSDDNKDAIEKLSETEREFGLSKLTSHERSNRVKAIMLECGVVYEVALMFAAYEEENPLHARPVPVLNIDAAQQLLSRIKRALHILVDYQQKQAEKQAKPKELIMSTRAMCLVLGFNLAANAQGVSDLVKTVKVGKATVDKCVNTFLNELGLPALPGQRDEKARKKMSNAQKKNWRAE